MTHLRRRTHGRTLPFAWFAATGPSWSWRERAAACGSPPPSTVWWPRTCAPNTGCNGLSRRLPDACPASSNGRCARPATARWSWSPAAARPWPTSFGPRPTGRPCSRRPCRAIRLDRRRPPRERSLRIENTTTSTITTIISTTTKIIILMLLLLFTFCYRYHRLSIACTIVSTCRTHIVVFVVTIFNPGIVRLRLIETF